MKINNLTDKDFAMRIGDFLTSKNAFSHVWFPGEKEMVKNSVLESLNNKNHQYWYYEENGEILGAIGVRENHCNNGGYEMDEDYIAVHKDHRRKGIASELINKMENFVKENNGRYIHILTCDIDSYKPARLFYENKGYRTVAEIPNYFSKGEGRIDYFKEIS